MISWYWVIAAFVIGFALATELIIEWFYNMTMPQFRRYRWMSLIVRARKAKGYNASTRQRRTVADIKHGEWAPTRWWRVCNADGALWMQSSDEVEVRQEAGEIGQPVEQLWREVPRSEWRRDTPSL